MIEDCQQERLHTAIAFATKHHAGQTRKKSGAPYITHPLKVMAMLAAQPVGISVIIAGVLHDVVEDCDVSVSDIACRFGTQVASYVEQVTKRKGEPKFSALDRACASPGALTIKLADRIDNLIDAAATFDEEKLANYLRGTRYLLERSRDVQTLQFDRALGNFRLILTELVAFYG